MEEGMDLSAGLEEFPFYIDLHHTYTTPIYLHLWIVSITAMAVPEDPIEGSNIEDEDPVVAEYDIFIKPTVSTSSNIYMLQYPNRPKEKPYDVTNQQPLAIRVKPKSGFIEIDLSVGTHSNFDREKGVRWGHAVHESKEEGFASFGPSSGLGSKGTGAVVHKEADGEDRETLIMDRLERFATSEARGEVMNKMVVGGQILKQDLGMPHYMLGNVQGRELHLTPVSGIIQMRPQFHHLDAKQRMENLHRRREREADEPRQQQQPRAVQQVMKSTDEDNDPFNSANSKALLQRAQEEDWQDLILHDEESEETANAYQESTVIESSSKSEALHASMTREQYLEAISMSKV
ncbi:hypothetical protein P152DRAFT_100857 [Eremomyces bilateralis CBS 781.70]|uniref:Uncharacterized protein n=1 Tax=Eremomyces bilateralis CBS 781.70 TaxID=1392243 RepID=A0A6G1FXK7_9PEZI|nr:uncharacterized protein P152DRAFT_100857 [Eremomyces bilateralis CBS 781.70]KAF1810514.1 hypothetical protein P152DRAFT_100857 [Eremomyces bilateralis CBS 781.70]